MIGLSATFIGLNLLDILLTILFVGSGAGRELNPVMAKVLTNTPMAITFKVVVPLLLAAGLIWLQQFHLPAIFNPRRVLVLAVVATGVICLWNLAGIAISRL